MPQFIDHHEMSGVTPEMSDGIAQRIKAGEPDEHGVRGLNVFLGRTAPLFASRRRRTPTLSSRRTKPSASL